MASSEPSYPTTACTGYPNTLEKQDLDLKSHLMMLMENFKKDTNNSLKAIQENTGKKVEALEEETEKFFKVLKENTSNRCTKKNKTIQDLKMETEIIMKIQKEATQDIEDLGKKSRVIDASINNRIQETEKRISGAEDNIENIYTTVKKCKMQKVLDPKHPGNPGHNNRTKAKDYKYRKKRTNISSLKGQ